MSFPDENTLGAARHGGKRRRMPEATARVIRAAAPRRATLGTAQIATAAVVVFTLRSIYGMSWLVGLWPQYPNPFLALAAWIVLLGVAAATVLVARAHRNELPDWMFATLLAGLLVAIALDLWAIWPLQNVGHFATAAVASGMALVVIVTGRRARDVLLATAGLGVVLSGAILLGSDITLETAAQQITTITFAILPPIVGVVVVDGFRGLVRRELDRVLVQSTVSAPRFAVGMLASEELARLDLAAEDLLESVASGSTRLPLDPRTASIAASLATELRLHLIEGRRETWLYHAVAESDLLGKAVTLTDSGSLAGLLDPGQRDGLLSAVWLLVAGNGKGAALEVGLTVGPAVESIESPQSRMLVIPVTLTVPKSSRNRVDPGVWEAIRRVGQYSDSTGDSGVHITVQCIVENPADQAQPHVRAQGE